jgi:putative radical SAM enzyme (TIGR03279 family)
MAQYKSEGQIEAVTPGSPAALAGVAPGDRLLAINGRRVKDVIGYQFHQVGEALTMDLLRDGRAVSVAIRKEEDADLGLVFFDPTFDGIKRCNNRCPFCFVDQNAPDLRPSLDIKDDDYRYSFLYGGFITLTNLKEHDWERIFEERLSPLHVSVHATDPALRRRMLGNPRAPEIIPQLQRLAAGGIQAHTQLVLCPGINDGPALDQSIRDLAALWPHVRSVSAVPVGLTSQRRRFLDPALRPYRQEEARPVFEQIARWQKQFRKDFGVNFVYPSDEFYLQAGVPVPTARMYDGFEQYENGVGMVRQTLDEAKKTARRLPAALDRPVRAVVVCGLMAAQSLRDAFAPFTAVENLDLTVLPVENKALGAQVNCSGLLFGRDVAEALQAHAAERGAARPGDLVFLPRRMFDFQGLRTLDEWTFARFQETLGCAVIAAEWTAPVLDTILRAAAGADCYTRDKEVVWISPLG